MAEKAARIEATPETRNKIVRSIGKDLGIMEKDEIKAVNAKLKTGGESTFQTILKLIDAGGRVIMIVLVIITAIVNGVWAGILAGAEGLARGMREIDKSLSK
jgi:hypothetical protein